MATYGAGSWKFVDGDERRKFGDRVLPVARPIIYGSSLGFVVAYSFKLAVTI